MATETRKDEPRRGNRRNRLNVDQFVRSIEAGVFPPDARVELLDGNVVQQMTKFAPHNYTARQAGLLLKGLLPATWLISEEKSLVLGRYWRPEPDIAVIRGPNSLYRARDPKAADVGLLIEVAESTYAMDRGEKWRAYAAARIRVYWIINLPQCQIEVYSDPVGRGKSASYREAASFGPDDEIPVVIDGQEVGRLAVRDVLP
jgi:Uma2 family endonuclease